MTSSMMNVNLTANKENRLVFGLSDDDKSADIQVRRGILTKVDK